MTDHEPSQILSYAWQQQGVWSRTADKMKRQIGRSRSFVLWLGIAAAASAATAIAIGSASALVTGLTLAAAMFAALVPFAQRGANTERVLGWTRARAASEGLKTLVYEYLGNGVTSSDTEASHELGEATYELIAQVADLERYSAGISRDTKPLPDVQDIEGYIEDRVRGQIAWYRKKGFAYQVLVSRLRVLGNVLAALAAIIGVAATTFDEESIAVWIPFVTTVGSALVAHIAASRYDHMIIGYLRTAQQLEHLLFVRTDKDMEDSGFIASCEAVISIENQAWMTKWTTPDSDSGTTDNA